MSGSSMKPDVKERKKASRTSGAMKQAKVSKI